MLALSYKPKIRFGPSTKAKPKNKSKFDVINAKQIVACDQISFKSFFLFSVKKCLFIFGNIYTSTNDTILF